MAKKFRYSHLFTTKTGNQAITAAEEKLKQAEIGLAVTDGEEKILFKNGNGDVVAVPTEEQVDAKVETRVEKEIIGENGKAIIFNEADGGGAKFEHNDGTWSFVGVNDGGGAAGLAGQIYAVDSNNGYAGAKIDITRTGMYYTVGGDSPAQRMIPRNEIATKGDIDEAIQSGATELIEQERERAISAETLLGESSIASAEYDSSGKSINFFNIKNELIDTIDATPFIKDGMIDEVKIEDRVISGETVKCLVIIWNTDSGKQEVDIPLADIFNPDNYYTKTEVDDLLDEKQDVLVDGENIKTITIAQKGLVGSGNTEISITELSTGGETDVDEDNEGNIVLEAGEF